MAKRKNDFTSPAGDYIDQLNWQANHPATRGGLRSKSVQYEPKWKYKIGYRYPSMPLLGRIIVFGFVGLIVYLIFSSEMVVGEKVFSGVMFGFIFLIFFFAGRDASKDRYDDSKDLD